MRRSGILLLVVVILVGIGAYFFLAGERDDGLSAAQPAVPAAPPAVGDTAPLGNPVLPVPGAAPAAPDAAPPAEGGGLIDDNE